ncbi:hypothetical protein D9M70_558500 [compost metagenome]
MTSFQWLEDVQHFAGRHSNQLVVACEVQGAIARVPTMHPVGHALADGIELDAGADQVAITGNLVLLDRHELGRQQLQLQRYRQAIFRAARA